MPFFRVHTAFSGPPVIPHCKDIRFRVIAGYPDYGSSYHFYRIAHQRPQTVDFLSPVSCIRSRFRLCVCCCSCRLFLLLLFVSVSASAVRSRFRVCFCPHHPLSLLPSASASAVRSRSRRLFPLVPSAFPALCRATKKPAAITGPQAFRSRRFSPSGECYSASSTNTALS